MLEYIHPDEPLIRNALPKGAVQRMLFTEIFPWIVGVVVVICVVGSLTPARKAMYILMPVLGGALFLVWLGGSAAQQQTLTNAATVQLSNDGYSLQRVEAPWILPFVTKDTEEDAQTPFFRRHDGRPKVLWGAYADVIHELSPEEYNPSLELPPAGPRTCVVRFGMWYDAQKWYLIPDSGEVLDTGEYCPADLNELLTPAN